MPIVPNRDLTLEDLAPHMQREFEEAYEAMKAREKTSRGDFAEGFIAALLVLNSRSSFKAGVLD